MERLSDNVKERGNGRWRTACSLFSLCSSEAFGWKTWKKTEETSNIVQLPGLKLTIPYPFCIF